MYIDKLARKEQSNVTELEEIRRQLEVEEKEIELAMERSGGNG